MRACRSVAGSIARKAACQLGGSCGQQDGIRDGQHEALVVVVMGHSFYGLPLSRGGRFVGHNRSRTRESATKARRGSKTTTRRGAEKPHGQPVRANRVVMYCDALGPLGAGKTCRATPSAITIDTPRQEFPQVPFAGS